MYDPVKDGVEKSVQSVSYIEAAPPDELADLVHCFWELKTETDLDEDFTLHALPDACVNIMFNQRDTDIPFTASKTWRQSLACRLGNCNEGSRPTPGSHLMIF